jgi:hypothetical protein
MVGQSMNLRGLRASPLELRYQVYAGGLKDSLADGLPTPLSYFACL